MKPYSLCCTMNGTEWICAWCKTQYCGPCAMQVDRPGYWDPVCKKCSRTGWRAYEKRPVD